MIDLLISLSSIIHRHDSTIDLLVIWVLATGTAILAFVKLISWLVLRRQEDQTMVGVSLKWQKLAEVFCWLSLSGLYNMTLYAYYMHSGWGFWTRLFLRGALLVSMAAVAFYGLLFIYYLVAEVRRDRRDYI